MKRFLLWGIAATLGLSLLSCENGENDLMDEPVYKPDDSVVFYAEIESSEDTKVYADEDLMVLWHAEDQIGIFNHYTFNQPYLFQGETGANSGAFKIIPVDDFVTGNYLPLIYAVYPYDPATGINNQGELNISLPSTQAYAEKSFGRGANVMVSVTDDNFLSFKNVGGYLGVKLYGEGVSVSKVSLRGNAGEKIAGKATVTMPLGEVPEVEMGKDAGTTVTIVCDEPVTLGATADEYTEFWFVLPPTDFEQGITLTVTGSDGGVFEKSTSQPIYISRSNLSRLAPAEVVLEAMGQPSNEIWYTSTDGEIVTPANPDGFGANIVSNTYKDGQGVITFDGPVTQVGGRDVYSSESGSFNHCKTLASISLPESVEMISSYAFFYCRNLQEISLPSHLSFMGGNVFEWTALTTLCIPETDKFDWGSPVGGLYLSKLSAITGPYASVDGRCLIIDGKLRSFAPAGLTTYSIPEGVKGIGSYAFEGARELQQIVIPEGVTFIEGFAFYDTGLISVNIPQSMESFESAPFRGSTKLASFSGKFASEDGHLLIVDGDIIATATAGLTDYTIPDGVTSVGYEAFSYSNLVHLTVPEGVSFINYCAFWACSKMESIVLPSTVQTILAESFTYCSGLTSITINATVPPSIPSGLLDDTNNCPIYVPATSVDAYKAAENWSAYADRIQAIQGGQSSTVPEAVDLGLPSGLKWASCNIGATAPEESGDYFAYGEVETKATFTKDNYKWYDAESNAYFKYGSSQLGIRMKLDPADDAAHVLFGEGWSVPSQKDLKELKDNCDLEFVQVNGVNVMRFTSKLNGKSIVIPRAGYSYSPTNNEALYWLTDWTVIMCNNSTMTWGTDFYCGMPIRAVYGPRVHVESVTANFRELRLGVGAQTSILATVLPEDAFCQNLGYSSTDPSVVTFLNSSDIRALKPGRATLLVTSDDGHIAARCEVTVTETFAIPDAVNLGLPSGVAWASFNLGAAHPAVAGAFFAWGETATKDSFTKENYRFWDGSSYTKYNNTDNLTVLQPEDDAARVNLGGAWRMPTHEDINELLDNCTETLTTQNGIRGYQITGPNGNSIFIPLTERTYDSYWSSTILYPDGVCPVNILAEEYDHNTYYLYKNACTYKFFDCLIRPVVGISE